MRKTLPEPKRKNNIYPSVRVDADTHKLVQEALNKLNLNLEISLTTFQRLALKHFANKIISSKNVGLIFS